MMKYTKGLLNLHKFHDKINMQMRWGRMSKKLGLCLTGGGGRGAYQAGAMKALAELGILSQIQAFSGTSIGAANAAIVASRDIDTVKDIWFTIPKDSWKHEVSFLKKLIKERVRAIDEGIYCIDTFETILKDQIDHEVLKQKEVFVTVSEGGPEEKGLFELVKATYMHYMKKDSKVLYLPLKELTREETIKAIIASCSIPLIFPAVSMEHKKYYDGGVFDNIPIKPLIDSGCDEIIIIHLNKTILFHTKHYPDIKFHEIKHRGMLGGVLDFGLAHSQKIFDYGYHDTMDYFNHQNNIDSAQQIEG